MKWLVLLLVLLPSSLWASGAYPYRMPTEVLDPEAETVIGTMRQYRVKEGDTMLDIARHFDLGYNELMLLYPDVDPWLPPVGKVLRIPTRWVLPYFGERGIVINVAELRLYLFLPEIGLVKTYPIGIGRREHPTPFGTFKVVQKEKDPTWDIPPSLRAEFGGRLQIPPGPENPLGAYWIGLSGGSYGIHGTNSPWGIGRLVSHGCIRLYPEDIEDLFPLVEVGMTVKIIYEPVKFGLQRGKVYIEVHPDIYHRCQDLIAYGIDLALSSGLMSYIDFPSLLQALKEKKGIPVDVTRPGVISPLSAPSQRSFHTSPQRPLPSRLPSRP